MIRSAYVGALAALLALPPACGAPANEAPRAAIPIPSAGARLTVVTFFSKECPCQRAHDARLVAMARAYAPRGVAFLSVDAEGTAPDDDRAEANARGYPFQIVADPDGATARAYGAVYATYSVVVDPSGRVLYAGGIDTDRSHVTDDATPYLADAIDDALAGRPLRITRGEALGCALRLP